MIITFDDQFLLTVSEDGCLFIWKIIDKEGQGLKREKELQYTEEILVTKSELEEKVIWGNIFPCVDHFIFMLIIIFLCVGHLYFFATKICKICYTLWML